MDLNTTDKILEFIRQNGSATNKQLQEALDLSSEAITKQIRRLLDSEKIIRTGATNKVTYQLTEVKTAVLDKQTPVTTAVLDSKTAVTPVTTAVLESKTSVINDQTPVETAVIEAKTTVKTTLPATDITGVSQEKPANPQPIIHFCSKFGLEPEDVAKCHHCMYEWVFNSSYRGQPPFGAAAPNGDCPHQPWGIAGKLLNVLLWILAMVCAWLWKVRSVWKPYQKALLGVLILTGIGGFIYYQYYKGSTTARLIKTNSQLAEAQSELYSIQSQLKEKSTETDRLKKDEKEVRGYLDQAYRDNDDLKSAQNKLKQENNELQHNLDMSQAEHKNDEYLRGEVSRMQEQLGKDEQQRYSLQQQLKKAREEQANLESQLKMKQTSNDGLRQRIGELEKQVTTLQGELKVVSRGSGNKGGALKVGDSGAAVPISTPITMDQIIAFTKQGLPPAEIIGRIQMSHSTYHLQADDIAWLRKNGVSEEVIKVMTNIVTNIG